MKDTKSKRRQTTATNGAGTEPERRLIGLKAAAARCGISPSTVRRFLSNPASQFPRPVQHTQGGSLLFWVHELDAYMDSLHRHQPRVEAGT